MRKELTQASSTNDIDGKILQTAIAEGDTVMFIFIILEIEQRTVERVLEVQLDVFLHVAEQEKISPIEKYLLLDPAPRPLQAMNSRGKDGLWF